MKKILFSAYSLDVGGIETALVTLLNELINKEYDITLVLEKKQGIFLEKLDTRIKIIEYNPAISNNLFIRKVKNLLKRINFIRRYKNKFDFSGSFATYSLAGSFIARQSSKKNALWVHSNYADLFDDEKKIEEFYKNINVSKFKNIIFVSNDAKNAFINKFGNLEKKCKVINNIINDELIIKMSKEEIKDLKREYPTFLYVGRLTEKDKKISKIIEASNKLKENNEKFKVLFIGDGEDKELYIKSVKKYNLEKNMIFLGEKENPYPYFIISDFLILTSKYEGYPVVYNEAKILKLPIITTDVSDAKEIIDKKYGIVVSHSIDEIYDGMKKMLHEGFLIKEKFEVKEFNNRNIKLIEDLIN